MKFIIIDPKIKTMRTVEPAVEHDHDALHAAEREAGLDPLAVDHGTLLKMRHPHLHLAYTTYEFAFFIPAKDQHFFSLGRGLFAGTIVIYGVDEDGGTVDALEASIPAKPVFYDRYTDVEQAIRSNAIARPQMRVNGALFWAWPDPPGPGMTPPDWARGPKS